MDQDEPTPTPPADEFREDHGLPGASREGEDLPADPASLGLLGGLDRRVLVGAEFHHPCLGFVYSPSGSWSTWRSGVVPLRVSRPSLSSRSSRSFRSS